MTHENEIKREDVDEINRFIGEISEWKKQSIDWRIQTDKKLDQVIEFMEDFRTPGKVFLWTVRALFVAAIGSIATGILSFLRGHIHFN